APAMAWRFVVGCCLAGIYPLGMKLVITWTRGDTGNALGLLVGMLTLGTALPYGLRASFGTLPWQSVILASSLLALAGGFAIRRQAPRRQPARRRPAGLSLSPVPFGGLRLLRAHVGAVRLLGAGAMAPRGRRHRRRHRSFGPAGRAGRLRGDRHRRLRLLRRR